MADINAWNTAAASNNSAPPDGWPEGMQYSQVNNSARENMAVVARFYRDTNGSLAAGGVANTYTLTLNQTSYSAYFDGMYFVCSIPAQNTGACTINVNGIGAADIVTAGGQDLKAGALEAGSVYEFRYVSAVPGFQLMGSGSAVDVVVGELTNAPSGGGNQDAILAYQNGNLDNIANLGFADSTAHYIIENQVYSGDVVLRGTDSSGVAHTLFTGDPDASSALYYDGGQRLVTVVDGGAVRATLNNSPTASGAQDSVLWLENAGGTAVGGVGYTEANTDLYLRNLVRGGRVVVTAQTASGTERTLLIVDPDGDTIIEAVNDDILLNAGVANMVVAYPDFAIRDNDETGDAADPTLLFLDETDATLGYIGPNLNTDSNMYLAATVSGADLVLISPNDIVLRAIGGTMVLRDTSASGSSAVSQIIFEDSAGADLGIMGVPSASSSDFVISALISGADIIFTTTGNGGILLQTSGGASAPIAIRDTNGTGTAATPILQFLDQASTVLGYLGIPGASDSNVDVAANSSGAHVRLVPGSGGEARVNSDRILTEADSVKNYKTASTARISTTTATADPHLSVPVSSSTVYSVECLIEVTQGNSATPDFKFIFSGSLTAAYSLMHVSVARTVSGDYITSGAPNANQVVALDALETALLKINFTVQVITGGTLSFAWAQNTSTAVNTTVESLGYIKLTKLS